MVVTRSTTRAPGAATKAATTRKAARGAKSSTTPRWSHIPSRIYIIWLIISLLLVAWDTGYILGRPHTLPGGKWHEPIWTPYTLYSNIDLIYGWKGLDEGNGFAAAHSTMNIVESGMYIFYLLIIVFYARKNTGRRRALRGQSAGLAVVLGFGASLMTLSKALLYGKFIIDILGDVLMIEQL